MRDFIVYKHTSPSGKVYIGITCQTPLERWRSGGLGYKSCPHFWNAIQKYKWNNFKHEIIVDGLTEGEASQIEELLIALYDSTNPEKGYNTYGGGEIGALGLKRSEEQRKRMSEAQKNRSEETRKKMSESQKGRKASEETRRKMSNQRKGNKNSMYGKSHSEETKRKISEKAKIRLANKHNHGMYGKRHSEESKRKNSNSHMGQISANRRTVVCLETGKTFNSIVEAAKSVNRSPSVIRATCKGEQKMAGGFTWRYV